jgi:hypothetical protein
VVEMKFKAELKESEKVIELDIDKIDVKQVIVR